jgi:hypothetical protein
MVLLKVMESKDIVSFNIIKEKEKKLVLSVVLMKTSK